jgi:hypothetical protein
VLIGPISGQCRRPIAHTELIGAIAKPMSRASDGQTKVSEAFGHQNSGRLTALRTGDWPMPVGSKRCQIYLFSADVIAAIALTAARHRSRRPRNMSRGTYMTLRSAPLALERIFYGHGDPSWTRKALLTCGGIERIDDIRCERHVDDNVQSALEAVD